MCLSQDAPLRSVAVRSQTAWWRGRKLRFSGGKHCHTKCSMSHFLLHFFSIVVSPFTVFYLCGAAESLWVFSVSDTQAGWERAGAGWVRGRSEYIAKLNSWNDFTGRQGLIHTQLVFAWLYGVYLIRSLSTYLFFLVIIWELFALFPYINLLGLILVFLHVITH